MTTQAIRSTLYLEPGLHQALRLKAATAHRSMSEIVNDAVRACLLYTSDAATNREV